MSRRVRLAAPISRERLDRPKVVERVRLHEPEPKRKKAKANRKYLTEDYVAALPGRREPYPVWDAGGRGAIRGLHVYVQPTGTKTYRYSFRFKAAPQATTYKLGRWPGLTLEAARAMAKAAEMAVAKGLDPRNADTDPTRSFTFAELVAEWHKRELVGRKNNTSANETKGLVLKHTQHWANRPAATIRKAEAIDLLEGIRDGTRKLPNGKRARPQGPTANRLHAHLTTLFSWALRRDLEGFTKSPMLGVDQPDPESNKPRQRDWFAGELADAVVKAVWELANELGGDREKFLKLLILTGKRITAIRTIRWEKIDADWYWKPLSDIENKRRNKRITPIPLPGLAQRVLGKRPPGGGPVMHLSAGTAQELIRTVRTKLKLPKEVRERLGLPAEAMGLPDYLNHGLRHIFETRTGELGVLPHVRDLLLDHEMARSKTGRGYDHGAYKAQLLEALTLWASHVAKLIAPGEGVKVLR